LILKKKRIDLNNPVETPNMSLGPGLVQKLWLHSFDLGSTLHITLDIIVGVVSDFSNEN